MRIFGETLKHRRYAFPVAAMAYGLGICLLSQLLLRNLESFVPLFGMDEKTAQHIAKALGQLRHSAMASPWLLAAAVCGVLGWLLSLIPKRKGRIWACAVLAVLLLLPMLLGAVWLTRINGIQVGNLIMSVLPWL